RLELVAIVLLIEARQQLALLHRDADVDHTRYDLAGHAEAELAFIAWTHLADGAAIIVDRFGIDHDSADGPHLGLLRGDLAARSESERQPKHEKFPPLRHFHLPHSLARSESVAGCRM